MIGITEGLKERYPGLFLWLPAAFNLFYGVLQLYIAYIIHSYWYLTLGLFFLVQGAIRFLAVDKGKKETRKTMTEIGLAMVFEAVIIAGMTYLCIEERRYPIRNMILAIAQAAYSFSLMGVAVYNLFKSAKKDDPLFYMVKNISFVSAVGSILSLQRMMLGTFGGADLNFNRIMEAFSGAGAFLIIVILGCRMIFNAVKFR